MDALAAAPGHPVPRSAIWARPSTGHRRPPPGPEAIGLDVFGLYAGGRGGVLGDRTPEEVDEEFFFFKPG